jgi:hypothetical protein
VKADHRDSLVEQDFELRSCWTKQRDWFGYGAELYLRVVGLEQFVEALA